jgi:hypothetical protein
VRYRCTAGLADRGAGHSLDNVDARARRWLGLPVLARKWGWLAEAISYIEFFYQNEENYDDWGREENGSRTENDGDRRNAKQHKGRWNIDQLPLDQGSNYVPLNCVDGEIDKLLGRFVERSILSIITT